MLSAATAASDLSWRPLGAADGLNLRRLHRRRAAILEQPRIHQHAIFPNHFFGERLPHTHPHRADNLTFHGNWIQRPPAIVRRPHFVHSHFAGFFVDADLRDLRGVRIGWRRPDSGAFMFAAASFQRRSIGSSSGEGPVEVNRRNHGFLKCHPIFRPFVFPLLLQRSPQNLPFYASADRGLALCGADTPVRQARPGSRNSSYDFVIAESQILDGAVHPLRRCRSNQLLHFFGGPQCRISRHERDPARIRPDVNRSQVRIRREEINNNPRHEHSRYVIDFESMTEAQARGGWPELIAILETLVKEERSKQKRQDLRDRWWQFAYRKNGLYAAIACIPRMLAVSRVSPMLAVCQISTRVVPADSMVIFAFQDFAPFAVIQSRVHEIWAWLFSSTLEERLRYAPSDCFRTFPFPENFATNSTLETTGESYYVFRAKLMIERNEGLTKTYNRFHSRAEKGGDIARLRALHAEMDAAVLRAYGWDDLADRAAPEFIEQDADEGKTPKTRFDWPAEFKDEVLARLLALNAERAAAERVAGLAPVPEADEEDIDEEAVA